MISLIQPNRNNVANRGNKQAVNALLKVAEGLDKLASSIEKNESNVIEKTAHDYGYGTLGNTSTSGLDSLTSFCLR